MTAPLPAPLVVWLKSYQRLGHFPKLDEVPAAVVEHVRGLLDLSGEVTAEHADRTAKWHRGLVRSFMGVKYDSGKARAIAEEAIRRAVTTKDNPADLINVALEELVRTRRELPGFSMLDRMVAAIRTETNTALYAMVAARIDLAAKARLTRLLWLDPTSGRSEFDRLKTPAKAGNSSCAWPTCRRSTSSARPSSGWTGSRRRRSRISPVRPG